jgi:urease subunit gamma
MRLSPRDREMLLVHVAAELAKKRLTEARNRQDEDGNNVDPCNFKLNYPEAMAIITSYILEQARLGHKSVADLEAEAVDQVKHHECMEGVPEMMQNLAVEATFPDGTKMVTLQKPINWITTKS